jgi:DsbE subfamily thiol:disulfide oxidoreductase
MRRWILLLPLAVFLVLVGFFLWPLLQPGYSPSLVPSALINKPVPDFDLPPLRPDKQGLKQADLKGQVTLVNFFASWCVPCRIEQPLLGPLANRVVVVGIDYKDKPEDAVAWLNRWGDPYRALAADREGRVAIDFGVYGVPESYLIDKQGRIRYKQVGPFTPDDINDKLLPLVAELSK